MERPYNISMTRHQMAFIAHCLGVYRTMVMGTMPEATSDFLVSAYKIEAANRPEVLELVDTFGGFVAKEIKSNG